MDPRSWHDISRIDNALKHTQPDPTPPWAALFIAACIGVFLAWMGLNAIEKAAFDAVNGMIK